jgi:quinoprotein glucose dehydrogenase
MRLKIAIIFIIGCLSLIRCNPDTSLTSSTTNDWPEYHGGPDRNHYSALDQIDAGNINQLVKVWEYASGGADTVSNQTQIQCNPIIVDGILYGVSAGSQAFALHGDSGVEIWKTNLQNETFRITSRGVTYWSDGDDKRIFFAFGNWLYALNAATGEPIGSFGVDGRINLRDGLSRPGADEYVLSNTPGVVFENLIIMGTRVSEGPTALPGDIRAYDTRSGEVLWTFHTIPKPDEFGYDTWPNDAYQNVGGANAWTGMAIDRASGIVYIPTGSAAFDFYGGSRHGANLFANTLLALEARTGKRIWHYQLVHHDIWDRDPPATPNLFSIQKNGKTVKAVAQVTKTGYVFVFDRETGEPLFPIEERPVPASDVPGELAYPTQPFPTKPLPFTRQSFTEANLNQHVADREGILKELKNSKTGKQYIPIGTQRTILYPGTAGGAQWGGAAVDEESIMYVPAVEIPVYMSLRAAPIDEGLTTGAKIYAAICAGCHGLDRKGDHGGNYPGLVDVGQRLDFNKIEQIIKGGVGMMPAFTQLSASQRKSIIEFLNDNDKSAVDPAAPQLTTSPYINSGYNRWYDSMGYPVSAPPWGTLTAIDLVSGNHLWQVPHGEYEELTRQGIPKTGTDNYGGPVATASGLLFIAGTPDKKFKAIDKMTGEVIWEVSLPAAGYATPSTYMVNGKQYIVIACGGGKLRSKSGDRYVAFALD